MFHVLTASWGKIQKAGREVTLAKQLLALVVQRLAPTLVAVGTAAHAFEAIHQIEVCRTESRLAGAVLGQVALVHRFPAGCTGHHNLEET